MGAHHPECPERLAAIDDQLIASGVGQYLQHHEAPAAKLSELARVHPMDYITDIRSASPLAGIVHLDPDTAMNQFTWNAALHAAATYGCRITTTTISREQFALARERVERAGLSGRVTVLNDDYRDLTGSYSKLVSIEMIEAVGHQYFGTFFRQCASLLAPNGRMAIQAITIQESLYEEAKHNVDFIKRYIFPGSCIPSVGALTGAAGLTDLQMVHSEEIGLHYAETLKRWRVTFGENWKGIEALGFSDSFARLWEYYFCYCEGGFLEGAINDMQLVFSKPGDVARGSTLAFPTLAPLAPLASFAAPAQ